MTDQFAQIAHTVKTGHKLPIPVLCSMCTQDFVQQVRILGFGCN
jgi:hypothetical protein